MSPNREKSSRGVEDSAAAQRSAETLLIEYLSADDLVRDYTENFSAGTVFLETRRELAVGTPIHLQLSFAGLREPLSVHGVVCQPAGGEDQPGLGIELAPSEQRAAQDALVERIRQGDPAVISKTLRILVVEDNPHVAQLIRNGLQGVGRRHFGNDLAFDFRTARNGREAIDVLHREVFHGMIVDMYLPVLDGEHVIQHVRADPALCDLPIVAVSAGGEGVKQSALRAGANHFLAKPMRLKQITEVFQTLFQMP